MTQLVHSAGAKRSRSTPTIRQVSSRVCGSAFRRCRLLASAALGTGVEAILSRNCMLTDHVLDNFVIDFVVLIAEEMFEI